MPKRAEGCALLYDGECGPCGAFARVVGFLDPAKRISLVPFHSGASEGFLRGVPPGLRYRSFHFVGADGRVSSGADGVLPLVSALPGGSLASGLVMAVPIGRRVVSLAYGLLSRLHDAGSCPS